jgi:hypothetical protein
MDFLSFSESETFVFKTGLRRQRFLGQQSLIAAAGDWCAEFWRQLILEVSQGLSIYRK